VAKVVIEHFADIYPNVKTEEKFILNEIEKEEKQF
jgi:alanyl-tRNA synthetase